MFVIPTDVEQRRIAYCESRGIQTQDLIGYGLDGFVWKTNRASVIKVCRHANLFDRELAIYQRLAQLGLHQLQGFRIPSLLDQDSEQSVLELSLVAPPFILDFAAASLDKQHSHQKVTDVWNAQTIGMGVEIKPSIPDHALR